MSSVEKILSKYYKKYGCTVPNLAKSSNGKSEWEAKKLESKFAEQAKKLSMQNLRCLFDTCIELWLKSTRHAHIKTVSDLYHYHVLYRQDSFTKIDSPGKLAGEFSLSVYLHDSDTGKDYAILESPTLRQAFICKAIQASSVPTDSFTKQVMECLT